MDIETINVPVNFNLKEGQSLGPNLVIRVGYDVDTKTLVIRSIYECSKVSIDGQLSQEQYWGSNLEMWQRLPVDIKFTNRGEVDLNNPKHFITQKEANKDKEETRKKSRERILSERYKRGYYHTLEDTEEAREAHRCHFECTK